MKILAIDPSGSFNEGKGTSGWSVFIIDEENPKGKPVMIGQIRAEEAESMYEHWKAHVDLIKTVEPDHVVIEDYMLYASKSDAQINSRMETPKLIGIMQYHLEELGIEYTMQRAVDVLRRWPERLLVKKNYVQQNANGNRFYCAGVLTSVHMRDSLRHAIHFIYFRLPKLKGGNKNG